MGQLVRVEVDLESEEQREQELVPLVEATQRVSPHGLGQVVQDVADSLVDDVRRLGSRDSPVEEDQELPQRRLVHDVHFAQLHDQEVEDGASGGHRSVLFTRRVDFCFRFRRDSQLLRHLLRRLLRVLQHKNQLLVVHERAFDGRQLFQQVVLQLFHGLPMFQDILHKLQSLRFQIWLLHPDDSSQQLILQTLHSDGEVNDGAAGAHLRSVCRIGQLGRDEELETVKDVHFFVAEQDFHDAALLDEVLVEQVVQDRIKLLANIFN